LAVSWPTSIDRHLAKAGLVRQIQAVGQLAAKLHKQIGPGLTAPLSGPVMSTVGLGSIVTIAKPEPSSEQLVPPAVAVTVTVAVPGVYVAGLAQVMITVLSEATAESRQERPAARDGQKRNNSTSRPGRQSSKPGARCTMNGLGRDA
jgi:hypothetical protein